MEWSTMSTNVRHLSNGILIKTSWKPVLRTVGQRSCVSSHVHPFPILMTYPCFQIQVKLNWICWFCEILLLSSSTPIQMIGSYFT
jgi:hypothetical protein